MNASRHDEPLLIALPSKGRLQENAFAFFARAGLALQQSRGARDYRGAIEGLKDVEVLFGFRRRAFRNHGRRSDP